MTLLALLLLAGCATTTRPIAGDRSITPSQVAIGEVPQDGRRVAWGGVIVAATNLESSTELEILAYPLRSDGSPDLDAAPTGRFIARAKGYLETAEYAAGRRITIAGPLAGIRRGRVGEADYLFPLVQADELQLWRKQARSYPRSQLHFGVGVGSGGHTSGSVGIGVGL